MKTHKYLRKFKRGDHWVYIYKNSKKDGAQDKRGLSEKEMEITNKIRNHKRFSYVILDKNGKAIGGKYDRNIAKNDIAAFKKIKIKKGAHTVILNRAENLKIRRIENGDKKTINIDPTPIDWEIEYFFKKGIRKIIVSTEKYDRIFNIKTDNISDIIGDYYSILLDREKELKKNKLTFFENVWKIINKDYPELITFQKRGVKNG